MDLNDMLTRTEDGEIRRRGRPLKYLTKESRDNAYKQHRKAWYEKNKDALREKRQSEEAKDYRMNRKWQGYYCVQSNTGLCYISFSKDLIPRIKSIERGIKSGKEGYLFSKFDNNLEWTVRIVEFAGWRNDFRVAQLHRMLRIENPVLRAIY